MKKPAIDRIRDSEVSEKLLTPIFHFIVITLPLVVVWFVGISFVFVVLLDLDKDTTPITNIAAGLCVVLAGLCFSMTRSVFLIQHIKEAVHFSGERFFHSAIFFILASIIKYASLALLGMEELATYDVALYIIEVFFGLLIVPLFMFAFWDAENGIRNINYVLWNQFYERRHLYKTG